MVHRARETFYSFPFAPAFSKKCSPDPGVSCVLGTCSKHPLQHHYYSLLWNRLCSQARRWRNVPSLMQSGAKGPRRYFFSCLERVPGHLCTCYQHTHNCGPANVDTPENWCVAGPWYRDVVSPSLQVPSSLALANLPQGMYL